MNRRDPCNINRPTPGKNARRAIDPLMAEPAFRGSDEASRNFRPAPARKVADDPIGILRTRQVETCGRAFRFQRSVEGGGKERVFRNLTFADKLLHREIRHLRCGICERGESDGTVRSAEIDADGVFRFRHEFFTSGRRGCRPGHVADRCPSACLLR